MGIKASDLAGGLIGGSVAKSMQAAEDAEDAQYAAAQEQRKAISEEKAINAAQQAQERRKQLREERIKRARVLATSQMSGTSGSSAEAGALGGLSTQLASGLGFNKGMVNSAENISQFNWNASLFQSEANKLNLESQQWAQIAEFGMKAATAGLG